MQMKLAAVFSDNMVLQQSMPVPVWGWATPGTEVSVSFAGQDKRATAGADGRWQVTLDALEAGTVPQTMTVRSTPGTPPLTLSNVLVGEVWFCSGQSNMAFPLSGAAKAEEEVFAADVPNIRLFTVESVAEVEPRADTVGSWKACTPDNAAAFSAVAYFFGRRIHEALGVPVGLINASWGGTPAEAWSPRDVLLSEPVFRPRIEAYERELPHFDQALKAYEDKLKQDEEELYPKDPGNAGFEKGWADPRHAVGDWPCMPVPGMWQASGLPFNGVVWFRKDVDVPADWAGRDLTLNLCPCDKCDVTYFNNHHVGGLGRDVKDAWSIPRVYGVPGKLVTAGSNTIAVRIESYVYAGGMVGSPTQMSIAPSDGSAPAIPLYGPWQYKVEHNYGQVPPLATLAPLGPGNANSPYILFNSMVHPVIPYAIRGALWYQGESNVARAGEYHALLSLLVDGWRDKWRQGDFPFLFVQLPNYLPKTDKPGESGWAELREGQLRTLEVPNTGMAVALELGDANDIHPLNKQDVGARLAIAALGGTYAVPGTTPCGPLFTSCDIEGASCRLRFKHADGGLVASGGRLDGFAIAGEDRKFVWADAKLDGETVVVSSPLVATPLAVRYAWADNPPCTLYNRAGLPASPFRTDTWPRA